MPNIIVFNPREIYKLSIFIYFKNKNSKTNTPIANNKGINNCFEIIENKYTYTNGCNHHYF
jgi:hypothetical protein